MKWNSNVIWLDLLYLTGVMRCWLAANLDGGMRGNVIHPDEEWEQLVGERGAQIRGSRVWNGIEEC